MKIRFGFTVGGDVGADAFGPLVDRLEALGFDSIWIPEVLLQPFLDPLVALSVAAGRTSKLKLGTHLIVPGKNPVVLARQLAHLDRLSGGRLLIVAVLGLAPEADTGAQVIARSERTAAIAEVIPLLRRLWSGDTIDHDGPMYQLRGVRVTPTPVQDPLELWMGGQVPAALRRCAELGDGWMPGLLLPHEAKALRLQLEDAATSLGRVMDPEHYGVNLSYATAPLSPQARAALAARRKSDDIDGLVPEGMDALRSRIDEWLAAGFSKFLLRPLAPPASYDDELAMLADEILPLTV